MEKLEKRQGIYLRESLGLVCRPRGSVARGDGDGEKKEGQASKSEEQDPVLAVRAGRARHVCLR